MPCYQSTNLPGGVTTTGRPSYKTEADCLNACKEGACCEGTTCSVKPACQCQGAGKVFKGVGTVCASLNGACCEDGPAGSPPTCSIKNECECVGNGKKFIGVGTTCDTAPCCKKCSAGLSTWCQSPACIPRFLNLTYSYSEPVRFDGGFHSRYIGAFSASGSVTLSGGLSSLYPCGFYGFSTADPTVAAQFNAGTFGVSIDTSGNYSVSHFCRLVLDGEFSGPQGVWPLYRPTTGSTVGERPVGFATYGRFEFAPAASGYCYQSGSATSSENPAATFTASVTGAYGVM